MTSATSLTDVKRRVPIARRLSVPSDPAKPSFLTLPSEIRNAVYDIIFLVEAPIHLTLSGSYGAQGMFHNHLFREVLVSGFAILFICRQVYHEAATRMMAGNKWIIYKSLDEPFHNSDLNGQVRQLAVAAVWLKKLGSRTTMLTKIAIDLDGNCPLEFAAQIPYGWRSFSPFKNLEGAITVWNFLKMLNQNPSLDIDFMHPKKKTYSELHFSCGHETGLVPEHLATVVRTLLRDTLKLTQYGSQVWGVYIQRDCLDGCVIFKGPSSCLEAWPRRDFQFSGDRSTLSWVQPTKLSLLELPSTLQTRIFRQIDRTCNQWNNDRSDQPAWVTWDLNKKTMVGASPVLSSICRSLRLNYDIGYGFWRHNHHRVRISSFLPSLDLMCNLRLEHFWRFFQYCAKPRRIREVNMYTYNKGPTPPSGYLLSTILDFHIGPHATLDAIRINLSRLFLNMSFHEGCFIITISIVDEGGNRREQATITRRQVESAMWTALKRFDNEHRGIGQTSPVVWMNGRGHVIEVERGRPIGSPGRERYFDHRGDMSVNHKTS